MGCTITIIYIISISLWTLLEILIYSTTNFEATFQYFTTLFVKIFFLMQSNRNLGEILYINNNNFEERNQILTLKHSIAVPAWCCIMGKIIRLSITVLR